MSDVTIIGTLRLEGDLLCTGKVRVDGTVIPVPSELIDMIYSCPTQKLISQNGKSPTITSLSYGTTYSSDVAINISGRIDGKGRGFPANFGPGANSILYAVNTEIPASIFGATHAGPGAVENVPGSLQIVEEQFTVNSLQFDQEFVVLQYDPVADIAALNIVGGTSQKAGVDFVCLDGIITWEGYALEPLIAVGDKIRVLYLAETSRIYPPPKGNYGSHQAPTSIGSGSGEAAGGGGIKLYAPNGLVYVDPDATICMDGGDGATSRSGGGSGGSIWIEAFDATAYGAFSSKGGNASYEYAGGGGGGYIAVNYERGHDVQYAAMSVRGGKLAGDGVVHSSPIAPILADRFTGTVLNAKWWETTQEPVSVDNGIRMMTEGDTSSAVESLFGISGRNIKINVDYNNPSGIEPSDYTATLKLFSGTDWVAIRKEPGILSGIRSVNGVEDKTSIPYADTGTTFRILKSDETFSFQYIDATIATMFAEAVPELDCSRFSVELSASGSGDSTTVWGNFKVYSGILHDAESTEPVLYVDPVYGSDTSAGGALTPLRNLFVATAWARKNSTVVLYNGTHNPTEVDGKSLDIIGANGAQPVVTTLYVQDSTGSNWENSCITLRNCQGQVRNLRFSNAAESVLAENTRNVEISGCVFSDSTTGVRFSSYSVNPKVLRNTVHGVRNAIVLDSQVRDAYVYSNVIYDSTAGVSVSDASNYVISSNTMNNCTTCVNIDGTSKGYAVSNNMTDSATGAAVESDSSVYLCNNNFYGTAARYAGSGYVGDASNISLYPFYYNVPSRNFHLMSNSPDRSAGTGIVDVCYFDRDGARRYSPGYDIGAYCYVSTAHPSGDWYVDSSGDDYENNGSAERPFRTLDKAMSVANAPIRVNDSDAAGDSTLGALTHLDSYYMGLGNQAIFLVDASNHAVVLDFHHSSIDLGNALFVSPNGSDGTVFGGDGTDTGGDGSLQKPFRTVARALQASSVGANIICLSGDYPVFAGRQGRSLVFFADHTGVGDGRMFVRDLFETPSTMYPGHCHPDASNWLLSAAPQSEINLHDGYLAFTHDRINSATAISNFTFGADFEVTADLQQAFDPIFMQLTNSDNTVVVEYMGGDYTSRIWSGTEYAQCVGTIDPADSTARYFTDYICVSSQDVQNRYIPLTYLIGDETDISLNIVGGPPQELDVDFYIEDNLVKWDGKELDGEINAGEIVRVMYMSMDLSARARIQVAALNGVLTVRGSTGNRLGKLMRRALVSDYTGNPWSVSFYMDATGSPDSSAFGRGYVSRFSAVADSFDGIAADPYEYKTYRQPIILY